VTGKSNPGETPVRSYRCPYCRAEYPTEMLARVHVSYATDSVHESHDGMTPEVEPVECDGNGDPVGTAFTLAGQLNLHGLSLSEIPATHDGRSFDERERRALLVAAFNANRSLSETELRDRVAAHLAGRDLDPLPARDIGALCEHVFGSGGDGETIDDTGQPEITPAETRLRDLTPLQQAVIVAHLAHPDRDPTALATRVGTARSYPAQVIEGRPDLVARLRSRLERTSLERLVAERIPGEDLAEIRDEGLLETFDIDLSAVRERKRRHSGSGATAHRTTGVSDSPGAGNGPDRRSGGIDPVSTSSSADRGDDTGAGDGVDTDEDRTTTTETPTASAADDVETVPRAAVEAVREQVAFDLAVVEQEMELADPTPQQVRTKAYLEQILERLDELLS
jgi:hypothetical protein